MKPLFNGSECSVWMVPELHPRLFVWLLSILCFEAKHLVRVCFSPSLQHPGLYIPFADSAAGLTRQCCWKGDWHYLNPFQPLSPTPVFNIPYFHCPHFFYFFKCWSAMLAVVAELFPFVLLCRQPTIRVQGGYRGEPRADVRQGLHGRAGQAGLLPFSLSFQVETRGLWQCAVTPYELYISSGLWRDGEGIPHIRDALVRTCHCQCHLCAQKHSAVLNSVVCMKTCINLHLMFYHVLFSSRIPQFLVIVTVVELLHREQQAAALLCNTWLAAV